MEYKNNHYVARMLLKRFMSDNGEFFYVDSRLPEKAIIHRNPEGVFSRNHLYTSYDKDGNPDVALERDIYRKIESDTSPIIDKIVSSARDGKHPKLSTTEKRIWDEFFAHQLQRTPDFHRKLPILSDPDYAIEWAVKEYEAHVGPVDAEGKKFLADAVAVKRTLQAAKVKALSRAASRVIAALASRGLAIARIANPGSSFVIGSLPIVRLQDGKRTLDDPGVEAWLPIAHDVAVSPGGAANQEIFADIDNQNVDLLNQYVFRQSTEIAGRSRELLSSLVEKG